MPVSEKTKRAVWASAGGCCAICRERLLISTATGTASHLLGEVAHIVAEQTDGPRGAGLLTSEQRNEEINLLLLCFDHHKVIDDDPSTHTVETLQELRVNHLSWVAERLQLEFPWRTKLHNFYYINVPRLNLMAASTGVSLNLSQYGDIVALHELGWELNGLMLGFQDLLTKIELKAVPIEQTLQHAQAARGLLVSFDRVFRTKNIDMPDTLDGYRRAIRGDIKTDPHIYVKIGDFKAILVVDPRWITTTTAFVQFRPSGGKGQFAGLGIVNSCDAVTNVLSVTPLLIGLPSNPFIEEFYGSVVHRS